VRYSALVGGIGYGILHRRTLQGVEDKNFAQAEWKRKENLIKEAKEAYKNRLVQNVAAMQSDGEYVVGWEEIATVCGGREEVRARLPREGSSSTQAVVSNSSAMRWLPWTAWKYGQGSRRGIRRVHRELIFASNGANSSRRPPRDVALALSSKGWSERAGTRRPMRRRETQALGITHASRAVCASSLAAAIP
jgi:F-type H+-transporting ATP synthase subunit e